jgi:hypothetical protein
MPLKPGHSLHVDYREYTATRMIYKFIEVVDAIYGQKRGSGWSFVELFPYKTIDGAEEEEVASATCCLWRGRFVRRFENV